ncbi:MAG: NAD-dependent succinate-semialdehyde dehydrogenase [Aliivibrio sp.]|uniref:NAD-dependent succinate-semialdehyde dehydrogenase n=1 Tax=Aliivibrio sp. TaxID=1872443 RepID=UPI001A42FE4F|nr:NAD-dependent succinate-semialdehyde dehydrogenase [Aliivibrio sp.]
MKLRETDLLQNGYFVAGSWHHVAQTYPVMNPATSIKIADVAFAGSQETEQAIESASTALLSWRKQTAKQRSQVIRRWGELLIEHQHDLATILTSEQGKPFAEAMGEVAYAASFFEWFAEEGKRIYGDVIPSHKADARIIVTKQPIGVVAAITPWNFPLAMITRKAAPALAAGCTMVVKPSEETPLSALALAVLAQKAGIPAGVFNVVSGDTKAIGSALMASKKVRKVSFTGSTAVGKLLIRQAAYTVKKLSLELGGNAPFIVFDDADIDAAVDGAMASKYRNSGQTCVCPNRFFIQESVYDEFIDKFSQAVVKLQLANGFEEGATQGPLINLAAIEKVERHIADAQSKGAKVVLGGNRSVLGGTFFEPTIIAEADASMLLANEETFGPVAACFRFETEQQVLDLANDTDSGLAAYFYARDIGRVWRVAEGLETGIVGINEGIISTEVAPFGGVKESGLGREGSKYGIEDYIEIKYLLMGGL